MCRRRSAISVWMCGASTLPAASNDLRRSYFLFSPSSIVFSFVCPSGTSSVHVAEADRHGRVLRACGSRRQLLDGHPQRWSASVRSCSDSPGQIVELLHRCSVLGMASVQQRTTFLAHHLRERGSCVAVRLRASGWFRSSEFRCL